MFEIISSVLVLLLICSFSANVYFYFKIEQIIDMYEKEKAGYPHRGGLVERFYDEIENSRKAVVDKSSTYYWP